MLVDAEKVKEKLAKVCEGFRGMVHTGTVAEALFNETIAAIRQTDLTDCRVEVAGDNFPTIKRLADVSQTTHHYQGPILVEEAVRCWYALESLYAQVAELKKDAERYRKRRDAEWWELVRGLPAGHTTDREVHAKAYDAHSDWLDAAKERK